MEMLAELQQYYDEIGISPLNFRCVNFEKCKTGCGKFTQSKAALVGNQYLSDKLPRLLFISLDSGSEDPAAENRTIERVREIYDHSKPFCGRKSHHWYRTHEFAFEILKAFDSPMTIIDSVKGCFAHTNSAKCCMNKEGRREADQRLFDNCRQYMPKEIQILQPDIIVTQGKNASNSIAGVFPKLELKDFVFLDLADLKEVSAISINDKPVLWIQTYHPSCYRYYYQRNHSKLGKYSDVAKEFLSKSRNPSSTT